MKLNSLIIPLAFFSILFVSCGDDLSTDLLKNIQPTGDAISIEVDTFHISSETVKVNETLSKPDSLYLLGKFIDNVYGGTSADIITQFRFKEDYSFLNSSIAETYADSTVLTLAFEEGAYFGDTLSPIEYKVYELKEGLKSNSDYYTNISTSQYVDFTKQCGDTVQTISQTNYISKQDLYVVRIKLSNEFTQRFFNKNDSIFDDQAKFNNFFKGLYITTALNSGALLKVKEIQLNLYCHYKYKSDNSIFNIPAINFPVTNEVRSVNRIQHPQSNTNLIANADTSFVCAPANLYTRLRIPIGRMRDRIKLGADKNLVINSAILNLNVINKDTFGTSLPYANNLLLIKGTTADVDKFFKNKEIPDDETSFLATISSSAITTTAYRYYYSYTGLSTLIKAELDKKNSTEEFIEMYLVPVRLVYSSSSSSTYSSLAPANSMQATGFYSGKNSKIPMKMEIVYTGF